MRTRFVIVFILPIVCVGFSTGALSGATITIGVSKDVTIFQNNVNNSSGGGYGLFAGTNGTSSPRRALIDFDIADNVPAGATIQSVQLTLILGQVAGSGGGGGGGTPTIDLLPLTADWGEGTAQSGGVPADNIGGQGQGAPAVGGDATWNARFYPSTLWANPGGDFSATASASLTIVGTTTGVPYTWGSTAGMVSDVQGWLNSPASNFGWLLKNEDEVDATTFRAFYSRDTVNTALHPALAITYAVPEPESVLLALLGAILATTGTQTLLRKKSAVAG